MTTVSDIVSSVITEISQVPGVATQIYSSDRIRQFVQNAWLMEIEEAWWPKYMMNQAVGLDETTGALTDDVQGDISYIDDFGDVYAVFPPNSNRRLRIFPPIRNPLYISGASAPMYLMPSYAVPHRPFKVYPPTATGPLVVVARQRHTMPLAMDTTIYIDPLLLMYDACWMYTVDDGTVPAQVNKFQMLAANRRKVMLASLNQQPLELDPRIPYQEVLDVGTDVGFFVLDEDPLA